MNGTGEEKSHPSDEASWPIRVLRGFNRWRGRYWPVRVLILLLLFAFSIYQNATDNFLIVRLVRMGTRATIVDSQPRLTHTLTRHSEAQSAHRLQQHLRLAFDRDGSGALEGKELKRAQQAGLRPEELNKRCFEADLSHLLAAGRRTGVVSKNLTYRRIGRQAVINARAESEQHARPYREEIDGHLAARGKWPDYGSTKTWKQGGLAFLRRFFRIFNAWWVPICCLAAFAVAAAVPRYERAAGMLAAVAVLLGIWALASATSRFWADVLSRTSPYYLGRIGYILLYGGLGLGAAGLATRGRTDSIGSLSAAFLVGVLFATWPMVTRLPQIPHPDDNLAVAMVTIGCLISAGAIGGGAWLWWPRRK